MELRRSILLVLLSVAQMIGASPARGEEFYAAQLRLGYDAMAAGNPMRAAEQCRIAAFGLLDQPAQLSSSLVCLALASSAADRPAELGATLGRFLEIESRFASYADAPVADAFRRAFDALLVASVDRERLASIASLANLGADRRAPVVVAPAETVTERPSETTPEPTTPETTTPVEPVVQQPPETVAPEPETVVERVEVEEVAAPEPEQPVAEPPAPAVEPGRAEPILESEADRVLVAARRLIVCERPGDAAKIVYRQLAKTPARRDLRLTLLEAATLNRDWRTAAAQTDLLQPFAAGEEVSMFYAAIALFESGRKGDARRLAERARDFVPKTEYVLYYMRRIEAME